MKTRQYLSLEVAVLALALSTVAATARAQDAKSSGNGNHSSFASLDKNHDGFIARSEIPKDMTLLRTRLSTYDDNHDGKLDAREFATAEDALEGSGQGNDPTGD